MPRKIIPIPVPPGEKYCHQCARSRSLAAFKPERRRPDGLTSGCYECTVRRRKERLVIDRLVREHAERIMAKQYARTPAEEDPYAAL